MRWNRRILVSGIFPVRDFWQRWCFEGLLNFHWILFLCPRIKWHGGIKVLSNTDHMTPTLSTILPLFWRHGIANFPAFAAKTREMLLWRHAIHDVFPRNWANALQNVQFFHHFTMKFDIFSLNLTWDSDFLILFLSTQNKLSMSSFSKIWIIRFFAVVNFIVRKFSFCCNFYVDVLAIIYHYTVISI